VGIIPDQMGAINSVGVYVDMTDNLLCCCGLKPQVSLMLLHMMSGYRACKVVPRLQTNKSADHLLLIQEAYGGVNWTLADTKLLPTFLCVGQHHLFMTCASQRGCAGCAVSSVMCWHRCSFR
jgi:hypothetical protein